jgi:hypothetical protein
MKDGHSIIVVIPLPPTIGAEIRGVDLTRPLLPAQLQAVRAAFLKWKVINLMVRYIADVRKEPGRDYGVEFPDMSGCITAGRTLDEARAMGPRLGRDTWLCWQTRGSRSPRLP